MDVDGLKRSEIYDLVYADRVADVEYYRTCTRDSFSAGGRRAIELGAGTGRVLVPTAASVPGMRFLALERDADRLALLQEKCRAAGLENVSSLCADMVSFCVPEEVDLVTAPFRVLQYCVDMSSLETVLRNVWLALRPGGMFIFDLFNPSIPVLGRSSGPATFEYWLHSARIERTVEVVDRSLFDQTQRIEETYLVCPASGSSSTFSYGYTTRFFFRDEVVLALCQAGFTTDRVKGSFEGEPFGEAPYPGELIFEARKE